MKRRATYHHHDLANALVAAAERLVGKHGVAGFSLREAARAVGVDPAACYRHFRDKDAILTELARRGFTRMAADMERAIATKRTPIAKLIALGHVYVDFAVARPSSFRAMFGPTGFEARDPRRRGVHARGPYEILEHTVNDWLGARRVEAAALLLWSGVHGVASLLVDGAIRMTARERRRRVDRLLRALVAAAGRPGA
jgi:AcrR family transcriptional regulator